MEINMDCIYCKGTKKYKKANNEKEFDRLVDIEMDKGYHINYEMAAEKVYKRIGYTVIDCPHCAKSTDNE